MTAWLLTWVWQGLALTLGVAIALRCVRRPNAATRYLVWLASLAALAWLGWTGSPHGNATPVLVQIADPIYIPSAPDILISSVVGIWAAIALVSLLRLLPGLHAVYAMRDRCYPFPRAIEATLPLWLEAKEAGRRTELMMCDAVPGATVLGLQRPCIAIPSSLAQALTAEELDQVILHEHAHVQRRDDWSRLVQTLLMSVLWIHPAAVFVSRALNREREMACDEWVVARTGLPKAYARCLTRAAELQGSFMGSSALIPTLFNGRHDLVRRVDRLLMIRGKTRRHVSFVRAAAAMFAMALISAQIQGVRFAELAEIMLPHVAGPIMAWNTTTKAMDETPFDVRLKPDTSNEGQHAMNTPAEPIAPVALVAPIAPVAPVAPVPHDAPVLATSVALAGVYPLPDPPAAQSIDSPNRWSALGTPGVEIASAAKKTSVGIASVFTRAGVSLARSF